MIKIGIIGGGYRSKITSPFNKSSFNSKKNIISNTYLNRYIFNTHLEFIGETNVKFTKIFNK